MKTSCSSCQAQKTFCSICQMWVEVRKILEVKLDRDLKGRRPILPFAVQHYRDQVADGLLRQFFLTHGDPWSAYAAIVGPMGDEEIERNNAQFGPLRSESRSDGEHFRRLMQMEKIL